MDTLEHVRHKSFDSIYFANLAAVFAAVISDTVIQPWMLENVEFLNSPARWLLEHVVNHTGLVGNGFFMALIPAMFSSIYEFSLKKNNVPASVQKNAKYLTSMVLGLTAVGVGLILYDAKVSQEIIPHIVKVAKDSADLFPGYYGMIVGFWTALLLRNKVFLTDGEETPASS